MNAELFLTALEQTDDVYLQQAGIAGGHFAAAEKRKAPRVLVRVLWAAVIVLLLTAAGFAVRELIGVRNDRWLYTPAASPESVVREAISRQTEKDYTLSVTVEQVLIDEAETQKLLAGAPGSMLAQRNGGSITAQLAGRSPEDVAAVYARYTVVYDHEKTWYRDGTLWQYFYLVRNADGNWELLDSTDPAELSPALPPSTGETQPPSAESSSADAPPASAAEDGSTAALTTETDGAVEAATALVKKWEEFDDVARITVDEAYFDPELTQAAIELLRGSTLAAGNGWREDFLRAHLAAVTVCYTVWNAPDPQLSAGSHYTETATYWLLRDPATGVWSNSEITGIMDAAD